MPKSTVFFLGEEGSLTLGKVNGAKIDRFFLGGGFLTLGKVKCHRHGLGVGAKIDRFTGGRGGFRSKTRQNQTLKGMSNALTPTLG